MTQHFPLDFSDPVHEGFFDAIQELLGTYVGGLRLERVNNTTIKIGAASENGQVAIAVQGRYRWRVTEATAALPGGLPNGEHPVYVTASDNNFGGTLGDPDAETDYSFGLQIVKAGDGTGTALRRQVGVVTVASGAITGLRQTVGSVSGVQIEPGALSGEGDMNWTREPSGALRGDIKANAVGPTEIAPDSVGAEEVAPGSLTDVEVAAANKDGVAGTASMRTLGIGSKQAAAGNDARLSDERTPKPESVDTGKLKNKAVTRGKMEDIAKPIRWYPPVIINAEQFYKGTSYGLLPTPDEVPDVVLPTDGLIVVLYTASVRHEPATPDDALGYASIFLNNNQLAVPRSADGQALPADHAVKGNRTGYFARLTSYWNGLYVASQTVDNTTGPDVTTGQAVGRLADTGKGEISAGGPCWIWADAGTYDVSVRFKTTNAGFGFGGDQRKLWVGVIANGS